MLKYMRTLKTVNKNGEIRELSNEEIPRVSEFLKLVKNQSKLVFRGVDKKF